MYFGALITAGKVDREGWRPWLRVVPGCGTDFLLAAIEDIIESDSETPKSKSKRVCQRRVRKVGHGGQSFIPELSNQIPLPVMV